MKKGIGIIGCGTVARSFYVPMLKTYQPDRQTYFHDSDPQAAREMAAAAGGMAVSLKLLISECEWICITAPPHAHNRLLQECALPGKKVICEKPFLLSLNEFDSLAWQVKENHAEVYAAHVRRMLPAVNLAKDFIQLDLLGNLLRIEAWEGGRMGYLSRSGYLHSHPMGGVIADTGSHVLDSILYIMKWDDLPKIRTSDIMVSAAVPEPVHEAELSFNANNIPIKIRLSRREPLANKMTFHFEMAILDVPVDLQDCIRISRPDGTFEVIHAAEKISTWDEAFSRQFYQLFEEGGEKLRMPHFRNLTAILDALMKNRI
jgi:predicted dehydrogenase